MIVPPTNSSQILPKSPPIQIHILSLSFKEENQNKSKNQKRDIVHNIRQK